jgi:Tol biopolymer transport system component
VGPGQHPLAYAGAGQQIWIVQADGTHHRALSRTYLFAPKADAYTRASPVLIQWSPDGGRLAFVYRYYHSGGHGNFYDTLAIVNADGGGLATVPVPATARLPEIAGLHWLRDSIFLMYLCRCDADAPEQVSLFSLDVGIREPDRVGRLRLRWYGGDKQPPAWSPDGARVAYEAPYRNDGRLTVGDADDWQGHAFLRAGAPDWSPDGSRLAFVLPLPVPTLAVMNADGSGLNKLWSIEGYAIQQVAWRPDPHLR